MKNKLFTAALLAALTLTACQSAADEDVINNGEQAQISFGLAGEFQVTDGALTRAVTPEYYYVAVSADAPSGGKLSTGYAGYFTTLSGVSLTLPKGAYTFYISAFKSTGYTINWATTYSSLTAGEFTAITSPIAYAPCFADQKVDRYYGKTTQTINKNTTVTVDGKRFAYGINVDIATPLEGKVVLGSESPAFSYTVKSTDAAKTEQNIFCLAGEDPVTASKSTTITMNLYDASNNVVATTTKTLTIARNHSKTLKVKALDPKANFVFNVDDNDMTNDGEEDLTPEEQQYEPNANGHDYVDLGITDASGKTIFWATCNIGATSPDEYGNYYAWGETSTKSTYTWTNYKYCNGSATTLTKYCTSSSWGTADNKTVLDSADDAAAANWGGSWRMPTFTEFELLITQCYVEWVTSYNGKNVIGYVFYKAKSDKDKGKQSILKPTLSATYSVASDTHIFFPAAGYRSGSNLTCGGTRGNYWSSNLNEEGPYAYSFGIYSGGFDWDYFLRNQGHPVRPVCQ